MIKEELEKAAYEDTHAGVAVNLNQTYTQAEVFRFQKLAFKRGAEWQASHTPAVSVEAGNAAEAWAQKRLGHFSLYDSLPISSVEDVAEEAWLAGFQARSHLVELLRLAQGWVVTAATPMALELAARIDAALKGEK